MRIIAGSARGTKLKFPSEETTRPTTARVKESMFSILHFSLPGARVLDLYAGSGQLGLEALSRGAESATFIDKKADVCEIIKGNAQKCKLFEQCTIAALDAKEYLKTTKVQYDIIFLDPPYEGSNIRSLLDIIARREIISLDGIVIVESNSPSGEYENFIVQKSVKYSGTYVTLFRLN